jgi:hypothetical protein
VIAGITPRHAAWATAIAAAVATAASAPRAATIAVGDTIGTINGATTAGHAAAHVESWLCGPPGGQVSLTGERGARGSKAVVLCRRSLATECAAWAEWLGAADSVRRALRSQGHGAATGRQSRLARLAARSTVIRQQLRLVLHGLQHMLAQEGELAMEGMEMCLKPLR